MKNILNDKKTEKPKQIRSKKGLWQRILSFITVFALVTNTMYSGELFGLFDFSTVLTVKAEGETPSYNITYGIEAFPDDTKTFSFDMNDAGIKMFCDYCYHYYTNDVFAGKHINDSLTIIFTEISESYGFMGLGNAKVPFAGSLKFMATNGLSNIVLPRALFTHVSTDAKITDNEGKDITLEITKNSGASSPLLADYVHPGTGTANWKIKVASGSKAFAGVIGQLEEKAKVFLEFDNQSSEAVSNTASGENDIKDVGELCGIMKAGSSLIVTDSTTTRPAVYSKNGNAGSLVGKMEGNASLALVAYPNFTGVSVTSTSGYAGGLVGETTSAATITFTDLSSPLAVGGTITGTTGAGGLYGHYINSASTFDLKDYNITSTVYAENCGGVFGVLENTKGKSATATSLTIQNTKNAETIGTVAVQSGSDSTYADTGYFGGIVGKYTTDGLSNSLILDGLTISATSQASFASFGGAIGLVGSAAYVKADGLNVTATNTAKRDASGFFGGLVGTTSTEKGVFIDLGSFKLTADSNGFKGGGVVGSFKNGVLRLSGTTDMASANASRGGQLVGENDNVLVYALGTGTNGEADGSGWTFKRSNGSQFDDLGTWGEVVRLASIEDSTNGILTLDSTNHTVTIKAAVITMGTPADFAKTALNIQLNQGVDYDCLKFEVVNDARTTRASLLSGTLTLNGDISLAGTGILGFMRDGSDSIGEFIGTLNGGSHTVSLAIGEKYGQEHTGVAVTSESTSEGIGQIYRHPYNGLFAFIGNGTTDTGTVKSLNIGGSINVRNKIDGMNIGGIAAVSQGNTTLEGITASQTINYGEPSAVTGTDTSGKNIGGLIGLASNGTDNGTISITGNSTGNSTISTNFIISGYYNSWNALGAAIGKVTSPKFTINIAQGADDTLTVSHTMVDNSGFTAGENSDGGGLIGYITSGGEYSNRKVNIKNLDFNNCTIINKATKNGGGFLGYAWLDTDTTIDGLTVTGGTITNSSPNVGVMCYEATGRWKVNNLTVTKMSMPDGAGTSLGMLVNKAYKESKGLYLDVLNAGYTLTNWDELKSTGIKLPDSLTVYDELAAESAKDVITGTYKEGNTTYRAGVVSINMNSGRHNPEAEPADNNSEARISETGTYQNQLNSASSSALDDTKYANANSRYYYNLDVLNNTNDAQNLLLWSLSKYAATNIAGEFKNTETHTFGTTFVDTLTGDANLTGLSFYPLANAGNYTLDGLQLTFDYGGIYSTAENKFVNPVTSDNYVRDPGLNNQHYLMHSGLFINHPAGNTITVSGESSIGGNFLEVGDYQAALISGTMNGNLKVTGSLELKGLTPKTKENTACADGYLLVHTISRPDNQTQTITMELQNISTSGYSSTERTPIAKSLIGPADGRDLNFKFSSIKLDARKAEVTDTDTVSGVNAALTEAYGTSRSIFSDATLVYSISTDQYANLIYNFTRDEDWGTDGNGGRNVTYGSEITNSKEYENKENKYYGDPDHYIRPDSDSNTEYQFSQDVFLPYVCRHYDPNADHSDKYNREIKVNVVTVVVWNGCGTYNDPYIINDARQLETLSMFLQSGNASILGSIILPIYDASKFNGISNNATGERWCTDKTGDTYHAEYTNNGEENFSATDKSDWPAKDVQYYLAGAYYKIAGDFELSSDFIGLGGTEQNTAFRGVIVGEKDESGSPIYTITNTTDKPFIRVTNGCVIKDIKISVDVDNDISIVQANNSYNNAYFGYNYNDTNVCKFYGGIIGEVMGGDNIIDNSYVTFENGKKIILSGTSGTIVPVGGYVGVVVFGGLIFKNMDARKTTLDSTKLNVIYTGYNLANNSSQEAWAAIYVNPIVGRVINGYAVNETGGNALDANGNKVQQFSVTEDGKYHDENRTERNAVYHTLKNGTKHYSIADLDPDKSLDKLYVENVPANTTTDGTIKIPNSQAMFVLSLITQSTAGTAQTMDGEYQNSLSYGTVVTDENAKVYGMSHNADYSDVGTPKTDSSEVKDYNELASEDTAANTAVPYIIRKYTVKINDISESEIEVIKENVKICNKRHTDTSKWYLRKDIKSGYTNCLQQTNEKNATQFTLAKVTSGPNEGMYVFYYIENNEKKYLWFNYNNDYNLKISDEPDYFILEYTNNVWLIKDNIDSTHYLNNSTDRYTGWKNGYNDEGNRLFLITESDGELTGDNIFSGVGKTDTIPLDPPIIGGYSARCVTSTLGYYDIVLETGVNYILPDSFRGLGSVGYYDDAVNNNENRFCIKLDNLKGNGCKIDEDIYLNKYSTDNYFNIFHKNSEASQSINDNLSQTFSSDTINNSKTFHGIGLFDSLVTKDANSSISGITLSGSLNTEIYNNSYTTYKEAQEKKDCDDTNSLFLACGGVVGWSTGTQSCKFINVNLDSLSIRGSCYVAGLLGYSGNDSSTVYVTVQECNVNDLDLCMTGTSYAKPDDQEKRRFGMGAYVGKVMQGGVLIYGTDKEDANTDLTKFASIKISKYEIPDRSFSLCAGGLVGYAGHGLKAYDVKVEPQTDSTQINIGGIYEYNNKQEATAITGGIVGLMQPQSSNSISCTATFINCEVKNINIAGEYAGGLYGGTWGEIGKHNNSWVPYSIHLENCKITGLSPEHKNTIRATKLAGGAVAYAKVSKAGNPNFLISNTTISNYKIDANDTQYAGGFLGYAEVNEKTSAIVCYIHDSSVENCEIGTGTTYSGGAVGGICKPDSSATQANQILGYNIKLKNINSTSSNMGAWIGFMDDNDTNTCIRFIGMAIYGDGFTNNIGNRTEENTNASFVFADYSGNCNNENITADSAKTSSLNYDANTHVAMPKYPYVNIYPQSNFGTDEVISGDGAVLSSESVSDYIGKTAEKTMAAKIYSDRSDTLNTRRYTTFSDTEIIGENKINAYMQRTITDDGDRISTYYTEKGITKADSPGYKDFACVVIANNTTEETTALINRYAQLVTNTTTDYAGTDSNNNYFNIVVESCKLENGKFVVDPSATPGLNYLNGQFSLIGSSADSLSPDTTFTLVDIQFMDPLTVGTGTANEKIAYHLYIPVYTIKEIEVTFSAAVMNGTNSVSYDASTGTEINNPYGEKLATATSDTHVDSLDTWYTTYIRYTYSRADLMALLDSGNLNWNHNKYFYLDKTSHVATSMLPENTYMVLVDPNGDHDKKYQASLNTTDFKRSNVSATTGRITFDLTKFSASDNTHFSPNTFNEMIAKKITAEEKADKTGKYNLYNGEGTPENTGAIHYVYTEASDGTRTFYEYVGNGGGWDLSLPNDYKLNESYYISMYVPTPSSGNPLYGYFVRTPDKFDAPSYPSGTNGTNNAITKSAKVNCYYGNNSNTLNRQVYIGNLFNQETELVVLPNDLEIDTGNRTLNIYAKTTIKPRNSDVAEILKAVKANIFHSFNIYLDRKGEDGAITNTIYGLANNGTDIQAWYSIGTEIPKEATDMSGFTSINKDSINLQDSYINVSTVKGGQTLLQNGGVTVYSRIRLEFASDDLAQQFPQRVANDTGVSVRAASNLAYDSASLAFSSMSALAEEPVATKHIYYRQSLDSASLNYYAKTEPDSFDADGLPSENLSRLGVNGRYSMNDCMPINSTAQYNISSIDSAAEDAEKLYLTLTLQKKTDTPAGGPYTAATYQNVSNINSYWGAVQRNETTHEVVSDADGNPVTVANTTNVRIKCGNYDKVIEVPANSTSIQIEIPRNVPASSETAETLGYLVDENGYIYIDVGFNAKTGENFTEYANYKVNISVRLLDNEDKEIAGSYAGDYLIYTNAKVNHDFLKDN